MFKLSVIIPIYNAGKLLTATVESVLNNTFKDYELLLIDDGSTDDTLTVCKRLSGKYENIKIIEQPHRGVGAARNAGLSAASGEYIAFIDADDMIDERYFETLLERGRYDDSDWVVCAYDEIYPQKDNGKDRSFCPVFKKDVQLNGKNASDETRRAVFYGPGKNNLASNAMGIYKRELIEDMGLKINEGIPYGEDLLFNYELSHHIKGFSYIASPLYHYIRRGDSSSGQLFRKNFIEEEFRLIHEVEKVRKKNGDPLSDEMLIYLFNQFVSIFRFNILFLNEKKEREKAYKKFDAYLADADVKNVYNNIHISHTKGVIKAIFFILLKRKKYEMIYRMGALYRAKQ